jgi:hypothetical protein
MSIPTKKIIKVTNIFFLQKNSYLPLSLVSKPNIRFYSLNINDNNNVNPVVVYANADTQKKEIMEENAGKTGIYR